MPLVASSGNSSTASLNARVTSQTLANLLYRIVTATEEHDLRLAELDSRIQQLDAEMKDLRFSVGWEFEVVGREMDIDANRHTVREGETLGLDNRPRRAYDLRGHYDREQDELIARLKRSFLGPDHEKYVRIAERRIEKMNTIIRKQDIRREIHLATLQTVLEILYRQTVLPLLSGEIALAQREVEMLATFRKVGEALRKDQLGAEKQLRALEEQRLIHQNSLALSLNELRQKTGIANLTLPTTLPLVAGSSAPPASFHEADATSRALTDRTDYIVAQMRLRLADQMAAYMAWYWPRVDFEVAWDKFEDRRGFLDQSRNDKGKQFSTELSLNVPLNSPYRSLKRREAFRAAHQGYARQTEQMRDTISNQVLRAYLNWQQAQLHRTAAEAGLAQALEEARQTDLVAQQLPEEIQGIAEVKQIEARMKALDAQMALSDAERELLLAQARWDYQMGDSPIDEAVAPYEESDRRAAEKKGWLTWWTNLMKW